MSLEESFSEIERRLRNLESLTNTQDSSQINYGVITTPTDWFLEGEWIWIKLTAKQATSGQYFYGWKQMLRLVDPTGGYIWVESGKEGSVNEFPAIALNNDNLSVTDGRRYPARWNPDTYQWIFFLRLGSNANYPDGSCHDVSVSVLWNGVPSISRDIPLASTDANCSNSTWIGVAPGKDGWPDVLDTFQQYVDYNGNSTLLESFYSTCSGGSPLFTRVPGFTPPTSVVLPILNIDNPATVRWNMTLHSPVAAVHDARNESMAWTYANGGSISPYLKQFVYGNSNIAVTSGNQSANQTYTYGNSVIGVCQITGPETGNITVSYSKNSPQNLNEKYEGKFRLTLMDYSLTGTSGPDPANAVYNIDQVMSQLKGKQIIMGQNGTTCDADKSIRYLANSPEVVATYGNVDYIRANRLFTNTTQVASMDLLLARRLPDNNGPTVKYSSCDANATIWSALPTDIKWSGKNNGQNSTVDPWSVQGQWTGSYPFEDIGSSGIVLGSQRILTNVTMAPFTTMVEEWWTGNISIGWRTVYASYATSSSYANLNVKWKVEGPV